MTLRLVDDVGSLRRESVMDIVREIIDLGGRREELRVIHFNVLGNHVHLLTEAENELRLARGTQGLMVRLARRINKLLGRTGKLFKERHHARPLRTPREVRNALRNVLLNGRHHAAERGQRLAPTWIDRTPARCGSTAGASRSAPTSRGCASSAAATWLLTTGWRRHGLLGIDEVPGCARY